MAAGESESYQAFASRDFRLFCGSRLAAVMSMAMQNVAVGWYVYELTHSAWALGLAGLFTFAPQLVFALLTGHVADSFDRRHVVSVSNLLTAAGSAGLFAWSLAGRTEIWPIFGLVLLISSARTFANPAMMALMPNLVPREHFGNAVAWNSSVMQTAQTTGPAVGGVLYLLGAPVVFAIATLLYLAAAIQISLVRPAATASTRRPASWASITAGLHFILSKPVIFGAISLDMFAVCVGGVTALLPIFADNLHVGSWGLGLLRSAQPVGALAMSWGLTRMPVRGRAGHIMLGAVAVYGVAIAVFGLSQGFWTSVASLAAVGAADQISVFIRHTLVQADTPDDMRGRVAAVNSIFVGASSSLGEFESGALAALVGAAPAVIIGGVGAIGFAVAWTFLFPALRDRDELVLTDPSNK